MTTDLTPGTPVWHPEYGHGVVTDSIIDTLTVHAVDKDDWIACFDLTDGWQPVTVVRPGEVAVRIDDLADDLVRVWADNTMEDYSRAYERLAIRAARAIQAQRDQAASRATPEALPTETTVRLACPECEAVKFSCELRTWEQSGYRGAYLESSEVVHMCPDRPEPSIADEPTEPGLKWTLDGRRFISARSEADASAPIQWVCVDALEDGPFDWANFTTLVEGWRE